MSRSLLERAAQLLKNPNHIHTGRWESARAQWVRDYNNRCLATFDGESPPDHRGCPDGAECDGKDIYWKPA